MNSHHAVRVFRGALLTTILICCGCESALVPEVEVPNQAPNTRVTGTSPYSVEGGFALDASWSGTDPDGEIAGYEWALVPPTGDTAMLDEATLEWTFTTDEFLHLRFEDDPADAFGTVDHRGRTLVVRAVDDEGLADVSPAMLDFTPTTLAPDVIAGGPTIQSNSCNPAGMSLAIEWEATDVDSKGGAPALVRTLLKKYGNAEDPCLLRVMFEAGQFPISPDDPNWSDWIPYDPRGDFHGAPGGIEYPKQPQSAIGSSYVFAVQARDVDGATTQYFTWGRNVRHFKLSDTRSPFLSVHELNTGTTSSFLNLSGVGKFDAVPGQQFEFIWNGDARSYQGYVAGYRYGWDLLEPDDPDDPGWAVAWGLGDGRTFAPSVTFSSGTHVLTVQAIDNSGSLTRGTIEINVLDPGAEQSTPFGGTLSARHMASTHR